MIEKHCNPIPSRTLPSPSSDYDLLKKGVRDEIQKK